MSTEEKDLWLWVFCRFIERNDTVTSAAAEADHAVRHLRKSDSEFKRK